MAYVLAIDQGTSSSRAIVFDERGREVGAAQRAFEGLYPQDGWVEQDPEALWAATLTAGREAIATTGVEPTSIAAIGIANQRETTLLWDARTGASLGNAIVWQDRRTAARCEEVRSDGLEPDLVDITGLLIDPYFSSTKLEWLLARDGVARRAAAGELRFGTVDSFLIWRLTKGASHFTDATNASRTQLFDIRAQVWSERLLEYFRIPPAVLPAVRDCIDDFGVADAEWFGAEIPIRGVAGDQQAALVGQGCFMPGMTKSTYGTGCFLIANTGAERVRSEARLLTTVGYRVDGVPTYAIEGSIFNAGVAIKWLRDQVGLIDTAADTEAAARRTGGDTGGVFVVPAFTGLGAPHWRPDARGLGHGLDTRRGCRRDRYRDVAERRVPDGGPACRGTNRRCCRDRPARRRRHGGQRLVLPVPGRRRRRCGGPPGEHRDHGGRRRAPGGRRRGSAHRSGRGRAGLATRRNRHAVSIPRLLRRHDRAGSRAGMPLWSGR